MNNPLEQSTNTISEEDKQACLNICMCSIAVRNIISYFLTLIIGFSYVFLQSRNLLTSKHIYISLILQFLNAVAVFIKSDTSLNHKLQESHKELKTIKDEVKKDNDKRQSIIESKSNSTLSSLTTSNINKLSSPVDIL